jgi:beta-xylosidase
MVFRLHTVKGDVMHDRNDLPGTAIQLGSLLGYNDEVTVRMTFTPEHALQQGGLLIWQDADHYVKLGRQFQSRPHLEFGLEANGRYEKGPQTFQYDPDAQNGQPIWLSIRRNGNQFTGWSSRDAVDWKQIGGALKSPPMTEARIGIFAHNGRTDAPAAEAVFDHLSHGASFHNEAQPLAVSAPECYQPDLVAGTLLLRPQSDSVCHSNFATAVPQGDWDLSTKLDFSPEDGALAGLNLRGSKSEARLIRWDINGPTITMEHLRHSQVSRPDFPGSPPVILRLSARNGRVSASYSRDDLNYIPLPVQVNLADIGDNPRVGIQAAQSTWTKRRSHPPDFQWLRFEVSALNPYR